jgi:hypothetical protein
MKFQTAGARNILPDSCFADLVSILPTTTRKISENNSESFTSRFLTPQRFSFSRLATWLFEYGGRAS